MKIKLEMFHGQWQDLYLVLDRALNAFEGAYNFDFKSDMLVESDNKRDGKMRIDVYEYEIFKHRYTLAKKFQKSLLTKIHNSAARRILKFTATIDDLTFLSIYNIAITQSSTKEYQNILDPLDRRLINLEHSLKYHTHEV